MGCKRYLMGRWKDPELLDYTPGTLPRATSQKKKKKKCLLLADYQSPPRKIPTNIRQQPDAPIPKAETNFCCW